ncbi:MAG: hypothetical protein ABIW49_13115 [Knoellia sp.]
MTPEEVLAWASGAPGAPDLHQTDVARAADHEDVALAFRPAESDTARRVLVGVIGFGHNPLVTRELLTLLASDSADLRAAAADSLGKIVGYPPRHPELREVLQQRLRERIVIEEFGWVLSTMLQSLGLVGVAEDEELLSKYLDSEDRQVRGQSRWAIERLRSKPW